MNVKNLPTGLLQKVQFEYASSKWKDGVYVFSSLDDNSIRVIINSFLGWLDENNKISDEFCADLKFILEDCK